MSYISENFGDAIDYDDDRRDEMKWDYMLSRLAEDRDAEENAEPSICGLCSGSGEGQHESLRCPRCKGRGEI